MTLLALLRHGTTEWNASGLVQGTTDIPLNQDGIQQVSNWTVPNKFSDFKWLSSPLKRAYQTASILAGYEPETDKRLTEMAWGDWEGRSLAQLREELGDLMVAWEAKGLDFHGPNGESPRDVQKRMLPMLREIAEIGASTIAVSHKGFIRSIYALAINWDMIEKPSVKLFDECIQLFRLSKVGYPSVVELNIQMTKQEREK